MNHDNNDVEMLAKSYLRLNVMALRLFRIGYLMTQSSIENNFVSETQKHVLCSRKKTLPFEWYTNNNVNFEYKYQILQREKERIERDRESD